MLSRPDGAKDSETAERSRDACCEEVEEHDFHEFCARHEAL